MKTTIFTLLFSILLCNPHNYVFANDAGRNGEVNRFTVNKNNWKQAADISHPNFETEYMSKKVQEVSEPPQTPDPLKGSYDTLSRQVILNWTDNSDNEDGFIVERALNGQFFDTIKSLSGDETSYLDNAITIGQVYHYRIFAYNAEGYSGYSNTIEIFIPQSNLADPVNIGNTTIFSQSVQSPYLRAQPITIPSSGKITSVAVYHGATSGKLIYGIYSNDGGKPRDLLAITPAATASTAAGWQNVPLTNSLNVEANEKLWLAWVFEKPTYSYFAPGTPGRAHSWTVYSGTLPKIFQYHSSADTIYSVYATFVPTGGKPTAIDGLTLDKNLFTIYPNPAKNEYLYININKALHDGDKIFIDLMDLTGRFLQSETQEASSDQAIIRLDKNVLSNEMVIIRITTGSYVWVDKLLIE